jgi:hypothetical protein
MNKRGKDLFLSLFVTSVGALCFGCFAVVLFMDRQLFGGAFLSLLTFVCLGKWAWDLSHALRSPIPYEWFKLWMISRVIFAGWGGLIVFLFLTAALPPSRSTTGEIDSSAVIWIGAMVLWFGSFSYMMWRAPHRHETDAAYKRRVGYREEE